MATPFGADSTNLAGSLQSNQLELNVTFNTVPIWLGESVTHFLTKSHLNSYAPKQGLIFLCQWTLGKKFSNSPLDTCLLQ